MKKIATIIVLLATISQLAFAQQIDHSIWTVFLQQNVSEQGNVNYKSITSKDSDLNNYLNQFVDISPDNSWSRNEKLAYWINAYNAFTIKLITDNYPVQSIKDINNPWDQKFIPINGDMLSLNHIEHEILRNMNEPRIHFAIVCASESCPKLLNEAFVAEKLDKQLTYATKEFLNDTSKNKITANQLELSKIFKWFSKDFKQNGSLIDFLNQFTEVNISEDTKIKYLDYSWELND